MQGRLCVQHQCSWLSLDMYYNRGEMVSATNDGDNIWLKRRVVVTELDDIEWQWPTVVRQTWQAKLDRRTVNRIWIIHSCGVLQDWQQRSSGDNAHRWRSWRTLKFWPTSSYKRHSRCGISWWHQAWVGLCRNSSPTAGQGDSGLPVRHKNSTAPRKQQSNHADRTCMIWDD